jgi:CysZ protein
VIQSFFSGIFAYGKAISYLNKYGLWKFAFIPGILSIVLAGAIATTAWSASDNIGQLLLSWYPFSFGTNILASISNWVGGIIVLVGGLIVYKHIVMILVSPFMSPLSQKIEEQLRGQQESYSGFTIARALRELWRGLRIAIRNIIREFFFVIPLFFLSFIPVIGLFFSALIFIVQAYYAGFGNMDYTLERHFQTKDSVHFVRKNRGLAIGIGTVFLLLLATGIGFLFAPPLAAVASTLETVKRLEPEFRTEPLDYV